MAPSLGSLVVALCWAQALADSYYSVLGVAPTASADTIKAAYRKQALRWHPDKVASAEREKAAEKFKRLQVCAQNHSPKRHCPQRNLHDPQTHHTTYTTHVHYTTIHYTTTHYTTCTTPQYTTLHHLQEAYETLSDGSKRRMYDLTRGDRAFSARGDGHAGGSSGGGGGYYGAGAGGFHGGFGGGGFGNEGFDMQSAMRAAQYRSAARAAALARSPSTRPLRCSLRELYAGKTLRVTLKDSPLRRIQDGLRGGGGVGLSLLATATPAAAALLWNLQVIRTPHPTPYTPTPPQPTFPPTPPHPKKGDPLANLFSTPPPPLPSINHPIPPCTRPP